MNLHIAAIRRAFTFKEKFIVAANRELFRVKETFLRNKTKTTGNKNEIIFVGLHIRYI